jgi:uncharacterized protein YxeA
MRTKLIIVFFIVAGALFCYWRINYLSEQNTLLKAENNSLKTQWEKEKENVLAASKRIQELNKIIEKNPASADYSATRIDGALLNELRKQYHTNKD